MPSAARTWDSLCRRIRRRDPARSRALAKSATERRGYYALQHEGVLDRAPDGDAVLVGRSQVGMRLDREVGDHGKSIFVRSITQSASARPTSPQPK